MMRSLLLYLYYTLRTSIHLAWIGLARRFITVRKSSDQQHKIVVIGDGIAAGVGDYVPLGTAAGISGYLEVAIRRDARTRQRWQVVNCGQSGTDSAAWLPDGALFKKVFGAGSRTADAEIVVIIAGGNDGLEHTASKPDAAATARNLSATCDRLRAAGKHVAVAAVRAPSLSKQAREWGVALNGSLRQYCDRTTGSSGGRCDALFGPEVNNPRYWQGKMLCWDGMHFSKDAYKAIAKETLALLRDHIVKVEWACFQRLLLDADGSDKLCADAEMSKKKKEQ